MQVNGCLYGLVIGVGSWVLRGLHIRGPAFPLYFLLLRPASCCIQPPASCPLPLHPASFPLPPSPYPCNSPCHCIPPQAAAGLDQVLVDTYASSGSTVSQHIHMATRLSLLPGVVLFNT